MIFRSGRLLGFEVNQFSKSRSTFAFRHWWRVTACVFFGLLSDPVWFSGGPQMNSSSAVGVLSLLRCWRGPTSLSLWLGEPCLDALYLEVSLEPWFAGGDGSRVQSRLVWFRLVETPAVVYGSWRLLVVLLHLVSPHHGYRSGCSVRKRRLSSRRCVSLCVSLFSVR